MEEITDVRRSQNYENGESEGQWEKGAMWPYWAIYWTLGNFLKPLATIILPKPLTFLGNFCGGVKSIIFLVKSFLGNFNKHLAIFSGHTGREWQKSDEKHNRANVLLFFIIIRNGTFGIATQNKCCCCEPVFVCSHLIFQILVWKN